MTHRYAYLHGFASSSRSFKGVALRERLAPRGVELELADLNRPSFRDLTYTGALEAIDALDATGWGDEQGTWRFIGSSMGGYLATRWAELHPARVDRLFLLCPGFDLVARWPALLGEANYRKWSDEGHFAFFDAAGKLQPVHWGFIEDARRHTALPEVDCPVRILHGRQDDVVPVASSRAYAAGRDHVSLVEVDDDHGLAASVDRIAHEVVGFFGLG